MLQHIHAYQNDFIASNQYKNQKNLKIYIEWMKKMKSELLFQGWGEIDAGARLF